MLCTTKHWLRFQKNIFRASVLVFIRDTRNKPGMVFEVLGLLIVDDSHELLNVD